MSEFRKVEPLELSQSELRCEVNAQFGSILLADVCSRQQLLLHAEDADEVCRLLDWLAQATGHYPVPEGYKLVPVEPTSAMIRAALMAWGMQMDPMQEIPEMYRAMLAAAPSGEKP